MRGFGQPDTSKNCPLCEQSSDYFGRTPNHIDLFDVECARCGRYRISEQAIEALSAVEKHLLSYVCRTWPSEVDLPKILSTDMQLLIARAPRRTVPEKCDVTLELMAQGSERAGEISKFDAARDYPLVTARDAKEVQWVMDALANRGLILPQGALTVAGWERTAQLRQAGPNSPFVFVAMSFSGAMSDLYDKAIAPAVRNAGYEPIRVDRKEHTNSIDDEIVGNIRKSRFMVADFTGQRAGVYFEAGMMAGLGRNVIWMCDKNELEKVHFDVRQRNFIDWESVEDARARLYKRILAIEGQGPRASGA